MADNTDETLEEQIPETEDTPVEEPSEEQEPEIELVIEDGTCVIGANSYSTLEEAQKYQSARGRTEWLELTEEEQKASIVKATQYINELYPWKGRRKYKIQELPFPRVPHFPERELLDSDGFDFAHIIPIQLKRACIEAAWYGFKTDLFTIRASDVGAIKREKNREKKRVEGAVEKEIETDYEYFSNKEQEVDFYSKYSALDALLKGLFIDKGVKTVNCRVRWDE